MGALIITAPCHPCQVAIYVTGFVKRGLPLTLKLPALTIHNFWLEKVIDLKFGL